MTNIMEDLYRLLSEQAEADPQYRNQWKSTKGASLAVLEEYESRCGERCRDVMTSLEAQRHAAHE